MTQTFVASNGFEVHYTPRNRHYDYSHLLFVFSGFPSTAVLARPLGNYDFHNALDHYPGRIVWIDDYFDGAAGYYIWSNGETGPADAVQELMAKLIEEYGVDKRNVSTTGYSKGGSAALYHGIRAGVRNIVATVPQFFLGSYMANYWPQVGERALGSDVAPEALAGFDDLLPSMVREDRDRAKNVYIVTSQKDSQYLSEIGPNVATLEEYEGFTLIESESVFVRQHRDVTAHHTSLLLGIYYLLANEFEPRSAERVVRFRGQAPAGDVREPNGKPETIVELERFEVLDGKLFVEGPLVLVGYPQKKYADVKYALVMTGEDGSEREFPLGSLVRGEVTRKYNKNSGEYVPYDTAYFATMGLRGIDVGGIAPGRYRLAVRAQVRSNANLPVLVPLRSSKWLLGKVDDESLFDLEVSEFEAYFVKIR